MDDPFISCPYVASHRVPRSRIQGHLIKCQKKYPILQVCPFNATHRYTQEELKVHVIDCPSRLENFANRKEQKQTGAIGKPRFMLQRELIPETDPNHEIWDD